MTTTQMIGIMMLIRETHMLLMPKIIDFDFLVGYSLFSSDCWILNSDCKLSECTFFEIKGIILFFNTKRSGDVSNSQEGSL